MAMRVDYVSVALSATRKLLSVGANSLHSTPPIGRLVAARRAGSGAGKRAQNIPSPIHRALLTLSARSSSNDSTVVQL